MHRPAETAADAVPIVQPARRPRRLRARAARVAVLCAAVLMIRLTGRVETWAFYFPSREAFATPPGVEDVSIAAPNGKRLHAWFIPARGPAPGERAPAVLHVHGNAGNISSHAHFSAFLPEAGVSVLIFDYRGYGRSDQDGRITRTTLRDDTRAALAALKARPDVDPRRIGVYTVSIGGAPGLAAAAEDPDVRAVCAVSPFASWRSIANHHAPVLGALLIPSGLDPIDSVRGLDGRPLLLVHGDRDEIIPRRHSERLAAAARRAGVPAELLIIPGGDHNSMMVENVQAQRAVADFFGRALAPPGGR